MRTCYIAQGTLLSVSGDLNGKEVQKEGICIYTYMWSDSLCCRIEVDTIL